MKTLSLTCTKFLFVPALFSGAWYSANAQKLPNVQTVNVLAPADVKTDGSAGEWGGGFEAYNKSTGLFYTMANDGQNLYLTIQATYTITICKILTRGISLTISNADKTSKILPLIITYPVDSSAIASPLSAQIKVAGIKELTDTLIVANNKYDIKAAARLEHQNSYTYELAIPIKYIVFFLTDAGTFNYNIKVNGSSDFSGRYTIAR